MRFEKFEFFYTYLSSSNQTDAQVYASRKSTIRLYRIGAYNVLSARMFADEVSGITSFACDSRGCSLC